MTLNLNDNQIKELETEITDYLESELYDNIDIAISKDGIIEVIATYRPASDRQNFDEKMIKNLITRQCFTDIDISTYFYENNYDYEWYDLSEDKVSVKNVVKSSIWESGLFNDFAINDVSTMLDNLEIDLNIDLLEIAKDYVDQINEYLTDYHQSLTINDLQNHDELYKLIDNYSCLDVYSYNTIDEIDLSEVIQDKEELDSILNEYEDDLQNIVEELNIQTNEVFKSSTEFETREDAYTFVLQSNFNNILNNKMFKEFVIKSIAEKSVITNKCVLIVW